MEKCRYCESDTNDFVPISETAKYSNIEVSINRQGLLRIRTYEDVWDTVFDLQDIIKIKFCPYCGRLFDKG